MNATDDPSWHAYPETLIHFSSGDVWIDLRNPITSASLSALAAMGLSGPFCILTAFNPRGRAVTNRENEESHRRLTDLLDVNGIAYIPCAGTDPTRMHREEGVAAVVDVDRAGEIAVDLAQSAYFAFDGRQFWIMPALVRAEPRPLPIPPNTGSRSP